MAASAPLSSLTMSSAAVRSAAMKSASLETVRRRTGSDENGFFLRWTYVTCTYGLHAPPGAGESPPLAAGGEDGWPN